MKLEKNFKIIQKQLFKIFKRIGTFKTKNQKLKCFFNVGDNKKIRNFEKEQEILEY